MAESLTKILRWRKSFPTSSAQCSASTSSIRYSMGGPERAKSMTDSTWESISRLASREHAVMKALMSAHHAE